ncbi:MAG: UDP-N-acetylglucosamine pyrophosphorylase [Lachnospiraceae bacterium]|nr:UDP-N-acetylglucosamine pyrophosphorylase [Lachnospiraceae bacterium]
MVKVTDLFDLNYTIAKDLLNRVEYPWEVYALLDEYIIELGNSLDMSIFEKRGDDIWVAKSAKIAPTACLNGPLIIDENAEVRHCAFIRGTAIIGKGATVGNSTEIKCALLFDGVQVPHYNYVGNSVLGHKSHMGAGSITSNLKSDKSLVTVKGVKTENGEYIDIPTGLKKFGAILGDNVEIGCNSVLNPGTVIGKGSHIYPLSMVRGFVPANSIYKSKSEIVEINIDFFNEK